MGGAEGPGGARRRLPDDQHAYAEQRQGQADRATDEERPRTGVHGPSLRFLSAVVRELQRYAEVFLLEQGDHGLQIVPLLAGDPQLVALDLRLNALGALVADLLADRLGLVRLDALDDLAVDLPGLAGLAGLAGLQRLQRDVAL